MEVIIVLVFFSLTLVIAGLVFFFTRLLDGDFEHEERLSLLPLADDDGMNQIDAAKEVDPGNRDDKLDRLGSNAPGDATAPPKT